MTVMASKCPDIVFRVVDINEKRIESWNNEDLSKLPIFEPGLKEIIENTRNKNLLFSTNCKGIYRVLRYYIYFCKYSYKNKRTWCWENLVI